MNLEPNIYIAGPIHILDRSRTAEHQQIPDNVPQLHAAASGKCCSLIVQRSSVVHKLYDWRRLYRKKRLLRTLLWREGNLSTLPLRSPIGTEDLCN
jgi:hypothetical protein